MRRCHGNDPNTLVVDELGLCLGAARVDVAVVNGSVHGYEIKSPCDTLARLPGQADVYGRVLDYVTIIVAENHAKAVDGAVPIWWGVWSAAECKAGVRLKQVRKGRRNPGIDPLAIAQLLWRDEALNALAQRGLADGMRSKPRAALWRRLADAVPLKELRDVVRQCLRTRPIDWRSGAPPA
jgi:hypothetical protein